MRNGVIFGIQIIVNGNFLRLFIAVSYTHLMYHYQRMRSYLITYAGGRLKYSPQNTAVQNPAVFKAVGQTADVNAAPFSKLIDSHLHLPVALHQNLSISIGIHVFLAG